MKSAYIMIVASEAAPAKEAEYNRWYTEKHIPMFLQYEGLRKASRYKRAGDRGEMAKYLAFYEFDTQEALAGFTRSAAFAEAVKDFDLTWEKGEFISKGGGTYELIKAWAKDED